MTRLSFAVTDIVAEMTGYPADLLDPDLDLEADLGVDTVKQAEVFAAVRTRWNLERDDTLQLREFPTLNHVAAWVRDKLGATGAGSSAALRPRAWACAAGTAAKKWAPTTCLLTSIRDKTQVKNHVLLRAASLFTYLNTQ